jgi:1-acyl-sn-glycerol-3-phosphate acyltransferase
MALWAGPSLPAIGPNVQRAHGRLAAAIGRFMIAIRGWRVEGEIPDIPRMVLIIAPHTSNWDFLTGLWVKLALRLGARFVGKHTLFRWPFGVFMRWLGGVPVDRSAAAGFVEETARALREAGKMTLVIAPEGTRRRVPQWKSGFYRVAVEANVPILLAAFDYSRKAVVFGPVVVPTGDYEKDLALIRWHYRPEMARRPENYS